MIKESQIKFTSGNHRIIAWLLDSLQIQICRVVILEMPQKHGRPRSITSESWNHSRIIGPLQDHGTDSGITVSLLELWNHVSF